MGCSGNPVDSDKQLNGVILGAGLEAWASEVYLYDGSEPFYQDYPTIRQSLLDNLEKGIKQGTYEGQSRLFWQNFKARQLRVTFYQDQLYQAQWDFAAFEDTDINALSDYLLERFKNTYGDPQQMEYPDFTLWIWQNNIYYLSIFQEEDLELTVEFRGPKAIADLKK